MVPDHELQVAQAGLLERRPKEALVEIALFIGSENAGLPHLCRQGLVLNRQAPRIVGTSGFTQSKLLN